MKKTFFMWAFLPAVLGFAVETDMPPGADMMIVSEDGKTRSSIYFAKERSRPTASRRKILTDSGHYFKYPPAQIIDPRPVADRLDGICRSMEYYEKAVCKSLKLTEGSYLEIGSRFFLQLRQTIGKYCY